MSIGSVLVAACSILASFVGLLYYWMRYKHSYWKRRGIPSLPVDHWFFGHLKEALFMRTSPGIVFGNLHQRIDGDDPVVGIYILHKPFLIIRHPEVIKQILIRDFHLFPNRHFTGSTKKDKIAASSLFSVKNPEWKYLRMKISPVFTSGKLKALFPMIRESADEMRDHLRERFADNSNICSIDTKDLFYKYTTNVISSVAFGIRTNCFDTPSPEFYHHSLNITRRNLLRAIKFFFLFFFPSIGQYFDEGILRDSTDYFRRVFWDSIDNRSATNAKRGDLIDMLMKLREEKDKEHFQFEGDDLLGQAVIFFVAGRETSITTMTYALCELAKHPEMQRRVRQEILERIRADGFTYETAMNMKYLHQVISETLRLYPPAPIIDRIPSIDYTLPGTNVNIEKGTPIYVALYGLHNDRRYHPDPERFDPERFSDERKSEMTPFTYMPFGEGPRNCIGMRLGQLQTAVGLITILRDYEVSLNPAWMCTVDPRNVFISPPHGFKLDMRKIAC